MLRRAACLPLFDDLGDDEIVVVDLGGILENVVGAEAVAHLVFPHLHLHGRDAGHGLDRARVDLVELGDEVEDAVQLMLEPRLLILGDGDAGKMGDAADSGAID
jgi:hypothetical protein